MKSAVLFMYLWSLAAGVNDKLLENLWDPYWPWFGPCIRQCTDPGINCLDVRKYSMPDSIMGRAGFSSMTPLKIYINVTFQAPAETIDICGEPRELTAVDPFTLHPDGLPYAEDLDVGIWAMMHEGVLPLRK
ncbi:hypothetical protein Btru_008298 [Bulinus truncatus]|nr:hypothetical protein Btru_008298 [Bulinus truncatus]